MFLFNTNLQPVGIIVFYWVKIVPYMLIPIKTTLINSAFIKEVKGKEPVFYYTENWIFERGRMD